METLVTYLKVSEKIIQEFEICLSVCRPEVMHLMTKTVGCKNITMGRNWPRARLSTYLL